MSSRLSLRLAVKGVSEPGCQDQILAGGGNFSCFFCGVYPMPISQPGAMEIQLLLFLAGDGGIRLWGRGGWLHFLAVLRLLRSLFPKSGIGKWAGMVEIYFGTVGNDVRAQTFFSKSDYWEVGGDGGNLLWNSWKCWNRRLEKCWNVGMEECWNGVMEECWNDWMSLRRYNTIQYLTIHYITCNTIHKNTM